MINTASINRIFIILLGVLALFVPVLPKILPLLIIATIIVWIPLVARVYKEGKILFNRNFLLLSVLYLLYIIGLIYSEDISYGLRDLETKLSLFIFPLLFSTIKISIKDRNQILLAFLAGCFVAMAYNILQASWHFYQEYILIGSYNFNHFLYFNLSPIIHPSYLSLYLGLATSIIIKWILDKHISIPMPVMYFALLCLIIFIFMLSSKAGTISLIAVLLYYLVVLIIKIKRKIISMRMLLIPAGIILLFVIIYLFTVPGATSRLEINPDLFATDNVIRKDTQDSSELRFLIWQRAMEIIKHNFFTGVGTGDVKDELMRSYESGGIKWAAFHRLNAHNQFLQTWIAVGVLGFLFLLPWVFLTIIYGSFNNDHPVILLGILTFINLLFESMLETQAGVIFISFFTCLFLFSNSRHK
jgi:O-antigen ligase